MENPEVCRIMFLKFPLFWWFQSEIQPQINSINCAWGRGIDWSICWPNPVKCFLVGDNAAGVFCTSKIQKRQGLSCTHMGWNMLGRGGTRALLNRTRFLGYGKSYQTLPLLPVIGMPGCFTAESLLIQLREFINGSACSNSVVVTKGIQESPSVRSTEPVLVGSLLDAGGTLGSAGAGLDEGQRVCSGALCDLWQALTFAIVVLRREDR